MMKILIFGANGMLGHTLFQEFKKRHEVLGLVRSQPFSPELLTGYTVPEYREDFLKVDTIIKQFKPDYILNCIGIIKQLKESKDKTLSLEVNSLWPHRLAEMAAKNNSRVIHFSTDCVFSGSKGNYTEEDFADARDTYGLSKYLGEIAYDNSLTLRTSIIGHELRSNNSLIDWFLTQQNECKGFSKAIYSGFPTIEVAYFIEQFVFHNFFSGLYHFSSEPISKYELLKLVASEYKKEIKIIENPDIVIDRSLCSNRLRNQIGFKPKSWEELIKSMHANFKDNKKLYIAKGNL